MNNELLNDLRCPIDPNRATLLTREEQKLVCEQCSVAFPIKNGIPVLVPDAAELPDQIGERSQLICQRRENRRINRN